MSTSATTSNSASTELPKTYVPADHEDAVRRRWDASDAWHPPARGERPTFTILIPPPNVTAALHLGHAFNNSLQDILARVHRMRGYDVLWMPGTDHAGIATQTVVEKRLMQAGKSRLDFSREAFVERVQEWKDEYERTITDQLLALGCSCDWKRQRFTMDEVCERAVMEGFFRLFRDGLIERGKRLVNWDPITRTALADDEVEMRDVDGSFWYLKYPVVDDAGQDTGEFVTVATTRPETMLGDTAVAVNPDDAPRAACIGRRVRLPIVGRIIPVVGDDYVVAPDPESDDAKARYASGFLKVTPAHDPNDWEIGQRHELPAINVMAPDGSISDRHGWEDAGDDAAPFIGLSREDARTAIVAWFKANDLLAEVREYRHAVGHSYRSHQPVEPYLSDQWYVRVTDDRLVGEAQRALTPDQRQSPVPAMAHAPDGPPMTAEEANVAGDECMSFHPARYARSYEAWHDNLRDWCISRQLWWGHRIPVWARHFGLDGSGPADADACLAAWSARAAAAPSSVAVERIERGDGSIVQMSINLGTSGADALATDAEADGFERDPDVLDTWFSSGLWPLSTMGWPEPSEDMAGLLDRFNPTTVLSTGRDIITLWVSRMVMFNRHFHGGRIPFRDVFIHPMIQDGHGQRMSKSLGNGVDPRDIIHSHGADALRFTLSGMATGTQDARLPVDVVSPFSGEAFSPAEITSPEGNRVAAPEQTCPTSGKKFVSGYGAASGRATPSDDTPLGRNSSNKFDLGRNFCNKLWNAARFALGRIESPAGPGTFRVADRPLVDRWILARLHATVRAVESATADYQFAGYAEAMYDFIWRDFCDWYLEAIKPTVGSDPDQQQVLLTVMNTMLRLLHPVCPFVTETLWSAVQSAGAAGIVGLDAPESELLAVAAWPAPADEFADADAIAAFERVQSLTAAIRTVRSQNQLSPKKRITLHAPDAVRQTVDAGGPVVATLAGLEAVEPMPESRPSGSIAVVVDGAEILLTGVVDAVDPAVERARLEALISERQRALRGFEGKLSNPGYTAKAPPHLVEETRSMAEEARADIEAAERALGELAG
ncbi:MAG: valine--tRNA ligase [Phycisphaerales bacterium]